MDDEQEKSGRLSRWSKRKLASAAEAETPVDADLAEETSEQAALDAEAVDAELEANRIAAEAIKIEDLDADSDFTVFMKDGVPELLKKQAMLALWRTNPVLANVDGLVDYGEDYASPDLIMKTFKSDYQIGKGYFDDEEDEESTDTDTVAVDESQDVTPDEGVEAQADEEDGDPAEPEVMEEEPLQVAEEDDLMTADEEELIAEDLPFEEEPAAPVRVSLRRRFELDA